MLFTGFLMYSLKLRFWFSEDQKGPAGGAVKEGLWNTCPPPAGSSYFPPFMPHGAKIVRWQTHRGEISHWESDFHGKLPAHFVAKVHISSSHTHTHTHSQKQISSGVADVKGGWRVGGCVRAVAASRWETHSSHCDRGPSWPYKVMNQNPSCQSA